MGILILTGCSTAGRYRETIDKTAAQIIEQKQMEALGRIEPFTIEKPEEILRKKLILGQDLLYSSPASLGVKEIEPIPHWPNDDYLQPKEMEANAGISYSSEPIKLTLIDALQIAAKNSRQYQSQKENVFRAALNLDLARDRFRNTFNGSVENTLGADLSRADTSSSFSNSVVGNFSRRLLNGVSLSARIGFDILKLLRPIPPRPKDFSGTLRFRFPYCAAPDGISSPNL